MWRIRCIITVGCVMADWKWVKVAEWKRGSWTCVSAAPAAVPLYRVCGIRAGDEPCLQTRSRPASGSLNRRRGQVHAGRGILWGRIGWLPGRSATTCMVHDRPGGHAAAAQWTECMSYARADQDSNSCRGTYMHRVCNMKYVKYALETNPISKPEAGRLRVH